MPQWMLRFAFDVFSECIHNNMTNMKSTTLLDPPIVNSEYAYEYNTEEYPVKITHGKIYYEIIYKEVEVE